MRGGGAWSSRCFPVQAWCCSLGCSWFPEADSSRRISLRDSWNPELEGIADPDTPKSHAVPRGVVQALWSSGSLGTCPVPGAAPAWAAFASSHPEPAQLAEQNRISAESCSKPAPTPLHPELGMLSPGQDFAPNRCSNIFLLEEFPEHISHLCQRLFSCSSPSDRALIKGRY